MAISKRWDNRNELRVVGMSRSGNHAIINWIINHLAGRYCFLNCAEPRTNPFHSARPLAHGQAHDVNYADFDIESERTGRFSAKDYLIHSYEDCFLGMVGDTAFEEQHDDLVGRSEKRRDILILRDPFNLFASREKSRFVFTVSNKVAIRIWKQHAREFLGRRCYLNQQRILVNYNAWASDTTYRRNLVRELDLPFTDRGFESFWHFGPGSSFGGKDVLNRWHHLRHEPGYRKLFDADALALANTIFGRFHEVEKTIFPQHEVLQQAT